jgi:AmpE protein
LLILSLSVLAYGQLFGLPSLLILIVVLCYSLGRGSWSDAVDEYTDTLKRGDYQAAFERLNRHLRGPAIEVADLASLHTMARSVLFYRGFERLFAVLFWFLLLGPAAAFFYRLTFLYRYRVLAENDPQLQRVERVLYVLEWLPVRALGLSFCILGNFVNAIGVFLRLFLNTRLSTQQMINDLGLAALCWQSSCTTPKGPLSAQEKNTFVLKCIGDIKAIHTLLSRSVVLWVALLAIMTILV